MTSPATNPAAPLAVWSYLSDSLQALTDQEYAALCVQATDEALAIECRALVSCLVESSLVPADVVPVYRRRYAQAVGVLVALRVEKYQSSL